MGSDSRSLGATTAKGAATDATPLDRRHLARMDRVIDQSGGNTDCMKWLRTGRVPTLDGMRGLAIGLVLAAHAMRTTGAPGGRAWRMYAHRLAIGVDVFFVISGFLITLILLRELGRAGRIDLRDFWRRRGLRIIPAYAVYLFFVAALCKLGLEETRPVDWGAALTYTTNLLPDRSWALGHTWSLSIEEQFYLGWPLILATAGRRRALWLLAGVLGGEPLLRYASTRWLPSIDLDYVTYARLDPIGFGCLLALAAPGPAWLRAGLARHPGLHQLMALAIIVASGSIRDWRYQVVARPLIESGAITIFLATSLTAPGSIAGRILESRTLMAIGTLSYSLYLWQQPFLAPDRPDWWATWPQNIALAVACSATSYFVVERPFLRKKRSIAAT